MRLTQITFHGLGPKGERIETVKELDVAEAVQFNINRNMNRYDGALEQESAKAEALQVMLARLLEKLIANGALRAEQVSEIFDYDVIAEND